jgi:hypothetical protein
MELSKEQKKTKRKQSLGDLPPSQIIRSYLEKPYENAQQFIGTNGFIPFLTV